MRVSGTDQIEDRQVASLKEFGIDERDIFIDKATGKNFNRPAYTTLKSMLRTGDTLVVHEFDRLGRNKELTLAELQWFKNNGIRLKALNLPTTLEDPPPGQELIMDTINSIIIELYTMMAQQEIDNREKRQKEATEQMPIGPDGKRYSKRTGNAVGRPLIGYPSEWEEYYLKWKSEDKEAKITAVEFMNAVGLKRCTFYKLVKQYEETL